jgi:hypothetical protein
VMVMNQTLIKIPERECGAIRHVLKKKRDNREHHQAQKQKQVFLKRIAQIIEHSNKG